MKFYQNQSAFNKKDILPNSIVGTVMDSLCVALGNIYLYSSSSSWQCQSFYHHHHHYHSNHGHLCKADGTAVVSVQGDGQLVIVPQGVCRALRLKYLCSLFLFRTCLEMNDGGDTPATFVLCPSTHSQCTRRRWKARKHSTPQDTWSSSSSSSLGHGRPSAGNGLAGSSRGDQFRRKKTTNVLARAFGAPLGGY